MGKDVICEDQHDLFQQGVGKDFKTVQPYRMSDFQEIQVGDGHEEYLAEILPF